MRTSTNKMRTLTNKGFASALSTLFVTMALVEGFYAPLKSSTMTRVNIQPLRMNVFSSVPSSQVNKLFASTKESYDRMTNKLFASTKESHDRPIKPQSKIVKRWLTGLSLGALGTLWICCGNGFFTLGFFFTSLIALNEYYSMVQATGVEPAKKTGIVASTCCYLTAAFFPASHELVMPLSATFLMLWLLVFNKKSASISEISSSLLGMFYVGFLPSFWVRLRGLNVIIPSKFPIFMQQFGWAHADVWTFGAIMTWWTWFSIVLADVGAYFVGKTFGKHKLATISAAAGAASPNKTVEGALGGMLACMVSTIVGANLMMWPLWPITGAVYGIMLATIALVGDLTASMMKRDAGMKDSGTILPGHGGLLDRIDSYMFTAPAAFFFARNILPLMLRII